MAALRKHCLLRARPPRTRPSHSRSRVAVLAVVLRGRCRAEGAQRVLEDGGAAVAILHVLLGLVVVREVTACERAMIVWWY